MESKHEELEQKTENAESADQPEQTPVGDAHTMPPKKSRRALWIMIAGLFLLILLGGIAYLLVARPWQTKPVETSKVNDTQVINVSTAQAVVTAASRGNVGSVLNATSMSGSGGAAQDGTPVYVLPVQQVSGNTFAAVPAQGSGIGFEGDAATAAGNYQAFAQFLSDQKFSLKTTDGQKNPPFAVANVSSVAYAIYASDKVVCSVWHADASKIVADRHVSGLGCANKSDYESVASNLKVLAAAYKQSSDGKDSVTIGMPTDYSASGYNGVAVPQVDGVQLASEGSAATTKAYYYKQSSAKDWKFVGKSDGVPACTLFSDDTLKQLFKDVKCS